MLVSVLTVMTPVWPATNDNLLLKAKQRCVMGVGMCLYTQFVQTKNKLCNYITVVVVYNNLLVTLVTLVTQKMCFVNNGLADKTSTEPGLILQCHHPHLSDLCSRPRLTQPYCRRCGKCKNWHLRCHGTNP